jgi:hypothetical protein
MTVESAPPLLPCPSLIFRAALRLHPRGLSIGAAHIPGGSRGTSSPLPRGSGSSCAPLKPWPGPSTGGRPLAWSALWSALWSTLLVLGQADLPPLPLQNTSKVRGVQPQRPACPLHGVGPRPSIWGAAPLGYGIVSKGDGDPTDKRCKKYLCVI